MTWGYRMLSFFLSLIPTALLAPISSVLGWVMFNVIRYRRGVILDNAARAFPEMSGQQRRRHGHRAYAHLMRMFIELFAQRRFFRGDWGSRFSVSGMEHVKAGLAKGKGILAFTGHIGSFEIALAGFARLSPAPLHVIVKSFTPGFDAFITQLRAESGTQIIRPPDASKKVLEALARNEIVLSVIDQNAPRGRGVFVEFFSEMASTMTGLAFLAAQSEATVVPAFMVRHPDSTHELQVQPEIPWQEAPDPEDTFRQMMQRYTDEVAAAIRRHPEQWLWTHKRWKTRPKPELPAGESQGPVGKIPQSSP